MSKSEVFIFLFSQLDEVDKLIIVGEIAKRYKNHLSNQEQEAIDCMTQHIKVFREQAINDEIASFGEPCALCEKERECKGNWISKMDVLLRKSSVRISLGRQEP